MSTQNQNDKQSVSLMAWFICILGGVYYCYEYFLRITPSVMSNELMNYYHLNATQLGNLSGMYYYVYAPMQLVVGLMMDRYRPRIVLTLACLFCALGSFLFAISPDVLVAQIGRLCIGFGSAFAFVGALKLATVWLPHQRFAMFAGLITSLGMLGAISGDVVLTRLVHLFSSWQESVFISAGLGVILAAVLFFVIRDRSTSESQREEGISLGLLIKQLGKICASRQLWINGVIGCLLYVPLSAFAEMWGIPFLKEAHGFSSSEAAWAISLVFLGWAVGGPIAGWMSDRLFKARRVPLMIGSFLAAAAAVSVIYGDAAHTQIDVALFVLGVLSGVQVIVFAVGRELSSRIAPATAVAFTNMVVMVGGMILQPAMGMVLDFYWSKGPHEFLEGGVRSYSTDMYQHALLAMPIGMLLAMVLAYCLRESYGHVYAQDDSRSFANKERV